MKERENLLTRMIRIYGMEDPAVIGFAEKMESGVATYILKIIVESHEELYRMYGKGEA